MSMPEKPIPMTFRAWWGGLDIMTRSSIAEAEAEAEGHFEAAWLAGQEAMRERAIIAVTCEKRPVSIAASIRALKPE